MRRRVLVCLMGATAALGVSSGAAHAQQAAAMPDLIVDSKSLSQNLIVRTESFTATQCDSVEDGITAGKHLIMRFTVSTPNIGSAPLVIGDPNVHVAANDGLFEFAPCHHHFHFRHYATYELVDVNNPAAVWRSAKRGFCMIDVQKYFAGPFKSAYSVCGAPGVPGNQGISVGWADIYDWQLQGQYFVLDGGDGQPKVPPGTYYLRVTVNPKFLPVGAEPCPYADPEPGYCHQLPESEYANNTISITVTVPAPKK
jgi:Lysyl oxidase